MHSIQCSIPFYTFVNAIKTDLLNVLSARESSRPMGWSKKGVDRISRLRVLTRNEQKIIDLMEYQDKKQRKKNRIECEDQLIQDVQKRKSSRNEEVLRKAIPGLEKKAILMDEIYY